MLIGFVLQKETAFFSNVTLLQKKEHIQPRLGRADKVDDSRFLNC